MGIVSNVFLGVVTRSFIWRKEGHDVYLGGLNLIITSRLNRMKSSKTLMRLPKLRLFPHRASCLSHCDYSLMMIFLFSLKIFNCVVTLLLVEHRSSYDLYSPHTVKCVGMNLVLGQLMACWMY